jgi:DNA polymerase-4
MAHQRWIALVDLDAFFASVEELLNPELRGVPLIVGGSPEHRGVVASASYAAREYGVRSAMPVAQALRLCPQAVVVPARHGEYGARSKAIMEMLHEITPVVEQVSVDEAFLDLTGCERLWGPVEEIGRAIRRRIKEEHGLPASVGIAANKLVAKIACDSGKPQGLVLVQPGQEQAFLAPLPIETLWGVGKVTGQRLRGCGIRTVGDLAEWSEEQLRPIFGNAAHDLYRRARGIDTSELHTTAERQSISQERTFAHDVSDRRFLERALLRMSDDVAARLRQRGMVAQTVRIKLRYSDFATVTRQTTLPQATDQEQVIYRVALELLEDNWRTGQPLRLLGVAAANLLADAGYQLELFDQRDQRQIRLHDTLDAIRDRYGTDAITRASSLERRSASKKPRERPENANDGSGN